jgi:hypothetical protein
MLSASNRREGVGLDEMFGDIETVADVAEAVKALQVDFVENPDRWQNWSLEAYLEAVEACVHDNRHRLEAAGFAPTPRWDTLWGCIEAGKFYE